MAQDPPHIAVGNVVTSEDDVFFERAFEQRQLRIQNESSEAVHGVQIEMPQVDTVVAHDTRGRRFQSPQYTGQRRLGHGAVCIDTDFFTRSDFQIEALKDGGTAGGGKRQIFTGHSNAMDGRVGQGDGQCCGILILRQGE